MIPLDLGASCAYFPLEIWPGRGLPVRSFPSFLPRCWFGGHEIDQVGVMIQWVMSNPRFFLDNSLEKCINGYQVPFWENHVYFIYWYEFFLWLGSQSLLRWGQRSQVNSVMNSMHFLNFFTWDSCDLIVSFVFSIFPNVPMYVDQ